MMHSLGLYINDLSMHDSSRDLVLAGTQQSAELRLALDQVPKKIDYCMTLKKQCLWLKFFIEI